MNKLIKEGREGKSAYTLGYADGVVRGRAEQKEECDALCKEHNYDRGVSATLTETKKQLPYILTYGSSDDKEWTEEDFKKMDKMFDALMKGIMEKSK